MDLLSSRDVNTKPNGLHAYSNLLLWVAQSLPKEIRRHAEI